MTIVGGAVDRCRRYRRRILEISRQVEAAHVAPAFSCLEVVDWLYHSIMRPKDIFIMSKGHGCLAQYVVMEDMGRIPPESMNNYGKMGDPMFPTIGAHPDYNPEIGIHASTGSLGHGLGIAAGQALAEKMRRSGVRVYVLLSDGECQSGSTWEAAMVAANLSLDNLVALVDSNGWGGMDRTDWLSGVFRALNPLGDKFRAFGWAFDNVSGHDAEELDDLALRMAQNRKLDRPRPLAIRCDTTKGYGVSFIADGMPGWHYRSPTPSEYKRALRELDQQEDGL